MQNLNKILSYPTLVNDLLYVIDQKIVFVFSSPQQANIMFLVLDLLDSNVDDLFEQNLNIILKICSGTVNVKIIGNEQNIIKYSQKLLLKNINILKEIRRDYPFEIILRPKLGKVSLSKPMLTRVLIVDDSATIRKLIIQILQVSKEFEVVGSIGDPLKVEEFLEKNTVDLITLDVHMPGMNGVELLKKIYPKYKIPTVMITSISESEGDIIMDALENGAVDYIQKPSISEIADLSPIITRKLKNASNSRKEKIVRHIKKKKHFGLMEYNAESLVVIGSSTGGVEALKEVLDNFPKNIPPVLIVQHIPQVFSKALADRFNSLYPFEVAEASGHDILKPNKVLIAQGGKHLKLIKSGSVFKTIVDESEKVNGFRPSVDALFASVKTICNPKKTLAVILTGMGRDGSKEMLELNKLGVETIAQDENSSVVFGMPKAAIEIGAADHIVSIEDMGYKIIELISKK